jgi:RNA polymerase sigma-70 factor (ECF subfamily)
MRHRRPLHDTPLEHAARAAASGDDAAWARLCAAVCDDVWRYCWSIVGDTELADDATQETFLRATTAIRRFRGDSPVKAWFFVLARRSVADTLTRHRRVVDLTESLPAPRHPQSPSGAVETTLLIEALEPDTREAFVLTQLVGMSYVEAADIAGCPVGTIRSRVFRARTQLVAAHEAGEDRPEMREADDVELH